MSMEKVNLLKEIMDSNLKDETKLELVKTLMLAENTQAQPIQVPYVVREVYKETPKPWWNEITCGDYPSKKTNPQELWDDSGWWLLHLDRFQKHPYNYKNLMECHCIL